MMSVNTTRYLCSRREIDFDQDENQDTLTTQLVGGIGMGICLLLLILLMCRVLG